jgi:hypothetical protein
MTGLGKSRVEFEKTSKGMRRSMLGASINLAVREKFSPNMSCLQIVLAAGKKEAAKPGGLRTVSTELLAPKC